MTGRSKIVRSLSVVFIEDKGVEVKLTGPWTRNDTDIATLAIRRELIKTIAEQRNQAREETKDV